MQNKVKKTYQSAKTVELNVKTVKMDDLSFDNKLFTPMRTKTRGDQFFSA